MDKINEYIDEIMDMIAENKMKEAMLELKDLLKGSPEFDKVILMSSRFNDVINEVRLGTVDFENAKVEKNQIRFALIKIVNELYDNKDLNPKLVNDVNKFIDERAAKINTVNIQGDGNINLQDLSGSNISLNINTD